MSSFGFSIGDVALIGKAAYQIHQQLSGEAVEDFNECARTCRRFVGLADRYEPLLVRFPDSNARAIHRDVRRILKKFAGTIEKYKPHLGRRRKRWSIRSALAKVRWALHAKAFDKLRRDLESKIQLISTTVLVMHL